MISDLVKTQIVFEVVTSHFKIAPSKLKIKSREAEIIWPRQVTQFLLYKFTKIKLKSIGMLFNGQDHTTVINSRNVVQNRMDTEEDVQMEIYYLMNQINVRINEIKRLSRAAFNPGSEVAA